MRRAAAAGAALVLLALLVRLLLRDRVPYVATLFYATPPVLLAAGALAVAAAWALARRRRPALASLAAALLFGAWQAGVSRFRHPPAKGDLRVLFWNASKGEGGWDALAADVEARDADLAFLVEAEHGSAERMRGGAWRWLGHGLAIGGRGRILAVDERSIGPNSRAAVVDLEVRGRRLRALLVDVDANPFRPRDAAFEGLDALCRAAAPDLVLGDFNTPRDSVHFDGLRAGWTHAFEAAGDGWDLTWPWPVPVLSIDHVWCAPALRPVYAEHVRPSSSDHAQVVVDVATK